MTHKEIHWAMKIFSVTPIIQILLMGYCLYRFAKPFMEISFEEKSFEEGFFANVSSKKHFFKYSIFGQGKHQNKKWTFFVGVTYSLTMLILYKIPLSFNPFLAYSIGVFAAFLSMCKIDPRNYEQKVFIAVTFFSLHEFSSAVAEIFYDNLYDFILNTSYMRIHTDMLFVVYVSVSLSFLAAEVLFIMIGIRCILKSYQYKYDKMSKKEMFILIIPAFVGVVGYEIIWSYRCAYISELEKISSTYDILSLFYYIIAVVMIVMVIVLYQNIKASQEEKLQNELLVTQMDNIQQHIEQVENLYQDIRSMRHDMTNHLITLERLYAKNKQKEALAYSTQLKNALSETAGQVISGNPITDVILQEMQNKAEKKKIRFDSHFHYPTGSNVSVLDISIILNNALQNALENTPKSEMAYISIISYCRKNAYMIEIRNYFAGKLQWNTETRLPITSKEKTDKYRQNHGYGLMNIRKVAEKYLGDIAIDFKNNEFCLSVLLMMKE